MINRLLLLSLSILLSSVISLSAQSPTWTGDWYGTLDVGVAKLRLIFHVASGPDGSLTATMDSPDEGASDLPLDSVITQSDSLQFIIRKGKVSYTGVYRSEQQLIEGTFVQGLINLPLTLSREKLAGLPRPQTPHPPFPYQADRVRIPSLVDTHHLAGTLTLPKRTPAPAVVLVTGSGPQDRDESIFEHKPFAVIADYLTKRGIAVLRYDDRGFGASTGSFGQATTQDFATDLAAAVAFLRKDPRIDPQRLVVGGHSEGALVGSIVASRDKQIAGLLLMAGPGLQLDSVLNLQDKAMRLQLGQSPELISTWITARNTIYRIVRASASSADFQAHIDSQAATILAPFSKREQLVLGVNTENLAKAFTPLGQPWMKALIDEDPATYLAQIQCPTLAIFGEKDLQVPPTENQAAMQAAIPSTVSVQFEVFPSLNHMMQTAETGMVTEYQSIEETISPAVLARIDAWLQEVITP